MSVRNARWDPASGWPMPNAAIVLRPRRGLWPDAGWLEAMRDRYPLPAWEPEDFGSETLVRTSPGQGQGLQEDQVWYPISRSWGDILGWGTDPHRRAHVPEPRGPMAGWAS